MVMYRDFAMRKARSLGIVGEVWNEEDGSVRLIAEGEEDALIAYIEKLKRGSALSHVERVAVDWKDATGQHSSFTIKYRR